MNQERQDELVKQYLLSTPIAKEDCSGLEIQELIFVIHSAKMLKAQGNAERDDLKESIKVCLSTVHEKIQNAEELYIAYEPKTNYPYIDRDDRIWIFSKEEYALHAQDYFLQQLLQLEMKKISREENIREFAELHRLGMRKIIVDNGHFHMEVDRDEILPPPDWSATPEISIPVTNPVLQHAMIRFFQCLSSRSNFEGKKQHLHALEGIMIDEITKGKYLVPMKLIEQGDPSQPDEEGRRTLQQGATLQFASLGGGEGESSWLPVFTDWVEFEKAYDKTEWSGNIATYADLMALSDRMDGVVINCRGISFQINKKNKQLIEDFRRQKDAPQPTETKIMLGEPAEYPESMIQAVINYMKKQKRIKKAYLLLMKRDNESSYLIIVEFEGGHEELFQGIADAATPHLQGMPLDLTGITDWVKDSIKDKLPFYKRKLLGLF